MTQTQLLTVGFVALLVVGLDAAPAEDWHHCRAANGKISTRYRCKNNETLADIREADEAMVVKCQFVGTMTASSLFGGITQGLGQDRARESAEKRAAEKGATHIVWMRQASDGSGANASGRAYKCEAK